MSSDAYSVSYRSINTATATDQKGETAVHVSRSRRCHRSAHQLNDCFYAGTAWQDGHLIITRSSGWMWLKDSKRVTIRKGTVGPDIMRGIVVCGMVKCAGYDIKILSDTSVNACDSQDQSQVRHTTTSAVMLQNENLEPSSASSSHQKTYSAESSNRNMIDTNENRNKSKPLNSDEKTSSSKSAPKHAHNNHYDSAPALQNQRQNPSEAKPSNIKTIIGTRPSMGLESSVAARREKHASMDLEYCVTARLETQENVDDFRRAMKDRKDKMTALKKSKVEQQRQVTSEQRKIVLSTRALCPIVQNERNRHKMKQNSDSSSSNNRNSSISSKSSNNSSSSISSSSNSNNSSSSSSNNNSSSSSNNSDNSSSSNNNNSSSSTRDSNHAISNSTNNINMRDQGITPSDSKCNGQDHLQQRDGSIEDRMKEKQFNKYMMKNTVAGVECGKNKDCSSKSGRSNGSNSNISSSSGSSNHSDINSRNTNTDTNTNSSCTEYPILDPQVLQVMRPHQLQAAVFLLNVLMGRTVHSGDVSNLSKECTDKVRAHLVSTVYEGDLKVNKFEQKGTSFDKDGGRDKDGNKDGDRDGGEDKNGDEVIQAMKGNKYDQNNSIKYPINHNDHTQEVSIPLTGAILADDMGTGKVRMSSLFSLHSSFLLSLFLSCLLACSLACVPP
jgi:hypothetical protein